MNELLQLMLHRRSIRKYTGAPIPEDKLKLILQAGLGSCWIQGRCREAETGQTTEEFCRELLGVPENYKLEAILSVGVPGERPAGYTEADLKEEKIHWEKF